MQQLPMAGWSTATAPTSPQHAAGALAAALAAGCGWQGLGGVTAHQPQAQDQAAAMMAGCWPPRPPSILAHHNPNFPAAFMQPRTAEPAQGAAACAGFGAEEAP